MGHAQTEHSPPVPTLTLWSPLKQILAHREDPGAAAASATTDGRSHSEFTAEVGLEPWSRFGFWTMVFLPNILHSGSLPRSLPSSRVWMGWERPLEVGTWKKGRHSRLGDDKRQPAWYGGSSPVLSPPQLSFQVL